MNETQLLKLFRDKSKGSSRSREQKYYRWEYAVYENTDVAESLIFSGLLSDREIQEFLHARGGHLDRDRNYQSWELMRRVRKRKNELSPIMRKHVAWVLHTHGW